MMMISACLIGVRCRYDSKEAPNEELVALFKAGKAIPICPEMMGGLDMPQASVEIAKVVGVKHAILKTKGTTCSFGESCDNCNTEGHAQDRDFTAELFEESGIHVWNEENYTTIMT